MAKYIITGVGKGTYNSSKPLVSANLLEIGNTYINSGTSGSSYFAGSGILLAGVTFSVNFGTTSGTVSEGNHSHNLFNRSTKGFVPPPGGSTITKFLREDGTWEIPPNSSFDSMSLSELNIGTSTTPKIVSAKTLNDWLTTKNPASGDFLPLTGGTLTGDLKVKNISPSGSDTLNLYGDSNDGFGRGANIAIGGNSSPHVSFTIGDTTNKSGEFNISNRYNTELGKINLTNIGDINFNSTGNDFLTITPNSFLFSNAATLPRRTNIVQGQITLSGGAGGNHNLVLKQTGGGSASELSSSTTLILSAGTTNYTFSTSGGLAISGKTGDDILLGNGTTTSLSGIAAGTGVYLPISGGSLTGDLKVKNILPYGSDTLLLYGDSNDGYSRGANIGIGGNSSPHVDITIGDTSTVKSGKLNISNRSTTELGSINLINIGEFIHGESGTNNYIKTTGKELIISDGSLHNEIMSIIEAGKITVKSGSLSYNNLSLISQGGNNQIVSNSVLELTSNTVKYTFLSTGGLRIAGKTSNDVLLGDGTTTSLSDIISGGGGGGPTTDTNTYHTNISFSSNTGVLSITGAGVPTLSSSLDNRYLITSGDTMSGNIGRNSSHNGYFVGSYNNVGNNSTHTNPIYTIGSSYKPSGTGLNNMYGIGYTMTSASFINNTNLGSTGSGWGLYVASAGDAKIFLNASEGSGHFKGNIYSNGNMLATQAWVIAQGYGTGSGGGTTYDTMTLTEMNTATSQSSRVMRADYLNSWADGKYLAINGTAKDSSKLGGLLLETGRNDNANRIVRTNSSGYIDAGWINTTSGTASGTINRIYCSQDAYIRYLSPTSFISNLGLATQSWVLAQGYGSGGGTGTDPKYYPTSLDFNISTGVLSIPRKDTNAVSQNLDGRYSLLGHTHSWNDISGKPTIPTNNNQLTNGAGYQKNSDITKSEIDAKILYEKPLLFMGSAVTRVGNVVTVGGVSYYPTAVEFNDLTGLLRIPRKDTNAVSVNLDGRYSLLGHTHNYEAPLIFVGSGVSRSGNVVTVEGGGTGDHNHLSTVSDHTLSGTAALFIKGSSFLGKWYNINAIGTANDFVLNNINGDFIKNHEIEGGNSGTSNLTIGAVNGLTLVYPDGLTPVIPPDGVFGIKVISSTKAVLFGTLIPE